MRVNNDVANVEKFFNKAGSVPLLAITSAALRVILAKIQFVAGALFAAIGAIGHRCTQSEKWAQMRSQGLTHMKHGPLNLLRGLGELLLGVTLVGSLIPLAVQLNRKNGFAPVCQYGKVKAAEPSGPQKIAAQQLEKMSPEELDRDWKLGEFFGHIKVIGKKGSERDKVQVEQFKKIGLKESDYEYAPTVDGKTLDPSLVARVPDWAAKTDDIRKGVAGCAMAHYQLIKSTKESYDKAVAELTRVKSEKPSAEALAKAEAAVKKYSSVLIMEDNCAFGYLDGQRVSQKGVGKDFREVVKHMPEDWDMFYMITMHGPWGPAIPLKDNPWVSKSNYGVVMKCFAVNQTAYGKIVEAFEKQIHGKGDFVPCDHTTGALHKELNVYMAQKSLAYRYASKSFVGGGAETGSDHWQPHPT